MRRAATAYIPRMATTPPLDAPLLAFTDDALARPLPGALARARADALAAAGELLRIPEAALTRPWGWIGGSEEEARYGAYRAAEALEAAEIEARAILAPADAGETRAARIVGPATAARWDLCGLVLPCTDARIDADPGGGEWTIRQVLGHLVASQRGYAWGTAWWLANPHDATDPELPERVSDELLAAFPEEDVEARGTKSEITDRLDAILDLAAERLAGVPDDRLGLGARWSGFPVTVGFRLGRWSSHLREHTIQLEKTLDMLDRAPSEPERLARLVLAAYGRAESVAFGRRPGVSATIAAADRIAAGAAEARAAVTDAAGAARA